MIALDARMAAHSGIGTYIRGLLGAFTPEQKRDLVLLGDPYKLAGYGCRVVESREPIYGLREQVTLAARVARLAPDVLHIPHYNAPLLYGGRTVVTVHDLNHLLFPSMSRTPLASWYARLMMGPACRRAAAVIADSGRTKADLAARGVKADKISVVWLGVDEAYRPASDAARAEVLRKHGLAPGYILYVGNIRPIKNVPRLLEAYAAMKRRRPDAPPLVLAGRNQLGPSFAADAARAGARLLGEVAFTDLAPLYSAAGLFAFPSLYEGFGLPPLEAMACGCPVVSSSEGSLAEVLGRAALFVDPRDPAAIAAGLERVLDDAALRAGLVREGASQAKKFSWRLTADATHRIYEAARRAR